MVYGETVFVLRVFVSSIVEWPKKQWTVLSVLNNNNGYIVRRLNDQPPWPFTRARPNIIQYRNSGIPQQSAVVVQAFDCRPRAFVRNNVRIRDSPGRFRFTKIRAPMWSERSRFDGNTLENIPNFGTEISSSTLALYSDSNGFLPNELNIRTPQILVNTFSISTRLTRRVRVGYKKFSRSYLFCVQPPLLYAKAQWVNRGKL